MEGDILPEMFKDYYEQQNYTSNNTYNEVPNEPDQLIMSLAPYDQ